MRCFVLAAYLAVASCSWAQPQVSAVSGEIASGQIVTIHGSGFGSKIPAQPIFFDRLTNIPGYSEYDHDDDVTASLSGFWSTGVQQGGAPLKYDTESPRTHGGASYRGSQSCQIINGPDLGGEQPDVVYISWWLRTNIAFPTGSNKFLRLWQTSGGAEGTRLAWENGKLLANMPGSLSYYGNWSNYAAEGEYANFEFIADSRVPGDVGRVLMTAYINSGLMHDRREGCPDITQPVNYMRQIGLEKWSLADHTGMVLHLTDIYIDRTTARVFLAESPTLATGVHKEIQAPVSWSSGQISFTVITGEFSAEDTAYIIVFDSENRPSAGFQVTIGGVAEAELIGPPGTPAVSEIYD